MSCTSRAPWLDDGDVQLYHGDVIQTLQALPAGIAQTCVTSPPYWGLRSYLDDGHADKHAELGLEPTPQAYVERMVAVFREVWRVLRDDGTVWLNLGDSYAGPNGWKPEHQRTSTLGPKMDGLKPDNAAFIEKPRGAAIPPGLKPKDLVGIPWRVAFALQADGWYLRSDIIWSKKNPMPESVTDRPTKAHEMLFLLTKQPRYFYDADAIREPHTGGTHGGANAPGTVNGAKISGTQTGGVASSRLGLNLLDPAGRNRRSVWTIPTQPFPEAHFATYPEELVRPCIVAGTSEKGECSVCGAPWQREVEVDGESTTDKLKRIGEFSPKRGANARDRQHLDYAGGHGSNLRARETMGWRPSCLCPTVVGSDGLIKAAATRPQTVLDPFIGSGTTALVARKHGRRCIGIDLSAEYLGIAARRLQQLSLFAEPA